MEVRKFRRQAYAVSTKATYKSQLHAYLTFCIYYGCQPLPASTIALSRYAAFLARSLSATSIPAYLNIVRILHLERGLEDPTKNNFHLATTLRGIRRCKGLTVSQKKPMTIGVRARGAGGAAAPPVSKIFGQNAKNSGNKETINDGIEK